MYPDHSLMPKESVRLAALGMLAEQSLTYAVLAASVRDFTSHIMGPNLELMGSSIQLLCTEGLIAPMGGNDRRGAALAPEAHLAITEAGRQELRNLLLASVRTPFNDLNKLVIALKMRFLDLLTTSERRSQIDLITGALAGEAARLTALRARRAEETGGDALTAWLDHDLGQLEDSLQWFRDMQAQL